MSLLELEVSSEMVTNRLLVDEELPSRPTRCLQCLTRPGGSSLHPQVRRWRLVMDGSELQETGRDGHRWPFRGAEVGQGLKMG